eukprot:2452689-Karenia_brevis.AAC.1
MLPSCLVLTSTSTSVNALRGAGRFHGQPNGNHMASFEILYSLKRNIRTALETWQISWQMPAQ